MQATLTTVQRAFKAAFDVDPQSISLQTTPSDIPAWDSMGHLALVSSLEQEFGLSFDVDEVMEMENVRQILRIVQARLAKEA
ncbi:MAG: acyl carrier protein [Verrucomicrobia bacterium]|nr:acyl carrier protein [Verrucomicrobiota bacterium]